MPEPRENVKPLSARDVATACRDMDAVEFARRHGAAFLLQRGTLTSDERPRWASFGTVSLPDKEAQDTLASVGPGHLIFPVPRTGTGPFAQWVAVGRLPTSQIRINEESISKLHALFRQESGHYVVSDGGSKNGTFINEVVVPRYDRGDPVPVKSGDRLRFGAVAFLFLSAEHLWQSAREWRFAVDTP